MAEALGVSKQSVGHWKFRGIPKKHMRDCAAYVGRSMDWLEFGEDTMPDVFSAVHAIAMHLQAIGGYDKVAVATLLAELADAPDRYQSVADGLTSLPLGAKNKEDSQGGTQ